MLRYLLLSPFVLVGFTSFSQKTIAEGILVYNITIETSSKEPKMADMFDGATTTVYLKTDQSRSEMVSGLGTEVTLLDGRTGGGVILKDYSGQKLMITLAKEDLAKKNRKYNDITFENTNETKVIYNYNCKKAIAHLKDGSSFVVYYTTDLNTADKDYDYQFKKLPGLALEYEGQKKDMKFKYTISKISIENVPASKFEIPKSGYRVLSYEETNK